jgi:hypothetical protein
MAAFDRMGDLSAESAALAVTTATIRRTPDFCIHFVIGQDLVADIKGTNRLAAHHAQLLQGAGASNHRVRSLLPHD